MIVVVEGSWVIEILPRQSGVFTPESVYGLLKVAHQPTVYPLQPDIQRRQRSRLVCLVTDEHIRHLLLFLPDCLEVLIG